MLIYEACSEHPLREQMSYLNAIALSKEEHRSCRDLWHLVQCAVFCSWLLSLIATRTEKFLLVRLLLS